MKRVQTCVRIGFSVAVLLGATGCNAEQSTSAKPAAGMLPDRLLQCVLGRATNIDTRKNQDRADIIYEGKHEFSLRLPAISVRTSPPPDATAPAEPVDPRTRVVSDKDGLTVGVPARFDRVVDLWPERVEMITTINEPLVNMIIISEIDEVGQTANLFMTKATDAATFDMQHIYSGGCSIKTQAQTR